MLEIKGISYDRDKEKLDKYKERGRQLINLNYLSTDQLIKMLEYVKDNGKDEFSSFAHEFDELCMTQKFAIVRYNDFIYCHNYTDGFTGEIFINHLKKYPNLYEFLEKNNMLDRADLLGELFGGYWDWVNVNDIDKYIDALKQVSQIEKYPAFASFDMKNAYSDYHVDAIYDITDSEEKLVNLKKIYCQRLLRYELEEQEIYEENGRVYRHEKYYVDYDDSTRSRDEERYNIEERPAHGWLMLVFNDGKEVKKSLCYLWPGFTFYNDDELNFPSKEEVYSMTLPSNLEEYRKVLKAKNALKTKSN